MTDLANLLNDAEAAINCRVCTGIPDEAHTLWQYHPHVARKCTVISIVPETKDSLERAYRLNDWLAENVHRYGYSEEGSFSDAQTVVMPLPYIRVHNTW